jgi:tetratricopeptide (TPR) repeat protein
VLWELVAVQDPFRLQVNTMNASVQRSFQGGDYGSALQEAQFTVEMAHRYLPPNDPLLGVALNNLALVSHRLGLNEQAEAALGELVEVDRATVGEDSLDHSLALNILAGVYRDTGRLAEAVPLLERVVEVRPRVAAEQPAGRTYLGQGLDNLGDMYRLAGRLDEAERCVSEAVDIFRRLGDAPALGVALNNLAMVNQDRGDLEDAAALLEQSRELKRAHLGPRHPDYLNTVYNLADVYGRLGRVLEAAELACEAADAADAVSADEHIRRWRKAARLCQLSGRYGEAETYLKKVISVLEPEGAAVPADAQTLADTYDALGSLYGGMDNLAMSEQMHERAAELLRSAK